LTFACPTTPHTSLPAGRSQSAVDAVHSDGWVRGDGVVGGMPVRRAVTTVPHLPLLHYHLDPALAPLVCQWTASLVVGAYAAALLAPEVLPKLAGGRTRPRAGVNGLWLDGARLAAVAADESALCAMIRQVRGAGVGMGMG
jgi:hypothetical protein